MRTDRPDAAPPMPQAGALRSDSGNAAQRADGATAGSALAVDGLVRSLAEPGFGTYCADFRPPSWLANSHLQSLLASSGIRRLRFRRRADWLLANSQEVLLTLSPELTLQGFHAAAPRPARGLVVLLHGWEGSAQSTYVLCLGARLLAAGYDVFRLNFRDHGETQHLSREIFHSARIDEVVAAVAEAARRFADGPVYLGGYSLGGNFALRVALRARAAGIALDYLFAVCPAIHPPSVLSAIEAAPRFYHAYFMRKWRRSLARKQSLYPERYDFAWAERASMRELTAGLVERHTAFGSIDAYLHAYSLAGDRLAALDVAGAILVAADDPVCPLTDYQGLRLPASIELCITERGGHCGFIRNARLDSFAEDFILQRLEGRDAGGGRR